MTPKRKAVFFGELLMRLGTKQYERFVQADEFDVGFTGAEANAAVVLANFGMEAYLVSSVPDHEIGQACVNHMRRFGLNTDFIRRAGKRLGIFYLETGASQRPSKVIYDRAGSSITELKVGDLDWDAILAGKDWFHFCGTAPALADNMAEVVQDACQRAKKAGLTVSCDLNYRRMLWPPDKAGRVMTRLMEWVDVLIANEEHSREILGVEPKAVASGADRDEDVAHQLCARFGLKYAAITSRTGQSSSDTAWSAVLWGAGACHRSKEYRIHVVDRVGAGDAFSGGLIYGLLSGMTPQETVDLAVAVSCLKHTVHGDFNHVSLDEVRALLAGQGLGRVQR